MLQVKIVYSTLSFLALVAVAFGANAQNDPDYKLFLKSGTILPKENISQQVNLRTSGQGGKSLIIIQFEALPDEKEKAELKSEGIELLDYVPNYAYVASITGLINGSALKRFKARAVITLDPEQKMDASLASGIIPVHAEKITGMVDVWINFTRSSSFEEITQELSERKIEIISNTLKDYQVIGLRIAIDRLKELAGFPFVQYVQVIPAESAPLVDKSKTNSRANVLGSAASAGFNLQGSGVMIGVGDNSSPLTHIDMNNRILDYSGIAGGYHGMAVIGIAAGAGIVNEMYKGYAPKSRVLARYNEGIWKDAARYVQNHNMVITSNSYAGSSGRYCTDFGEYTIESYILDKQAFDFPFLQHVFAAGNSGQSNYCSEYPSGFGTVLSTYHAAKNVISVGNTTVSGNLGINSSKGPVKDGRTKPDLTAQGSNVTYTYPGNTYQAGTGTSFAAPAVAGGLALLYERYRQMHNQANPKNALMKAILCNGADDKGLAGPDFSYGFGSMNLLRSVKMLNENNYFEDSLLNNEYKSYSVVVPDKTSQLKVMLYWNDPASSVYSGKTLVNNLDLSLIDPNGVIVLPKILNPRNVFSSATTGIDDVNNMEQAVIENPIPGNYAVRVNGKVVPQGPQNYFVVYDAIKISTTLTYPIGKERLSKGDVIYISWDSYGNESSTFNVQYSVNNGISWNTLNADVAGHLRQLVWTVPDSPTGEAKVRIIQNTTGVSSESESFVILGAPAATLSSVQCEGYIAVQWPAVAGATDYEVMMLKGDEMKSMGLTSALNYAFNSLSGDTTYFVSVRARINGNPGKRSLALSRIPNSGSCQGAISDNDLKVESIVSPAGSGRISTSTELSASQAVTVRIKNLDDVSVNQPIQIGYSLGDENSPVFWETINPLILPGASYEHTFLKQADLHAIGSYRIKVYLKTAADLIESNNSLVKTFKQFDNLPVVLPFLDNFENLALVETNSAAAGLVGGDRYDFTNSSTFGRLRTVDSSGVLPLGNKSIFLDASQSIDLPNTNFLTATFNLSHYQVAADEIKLSFKFRGIGRVWVRGKDTLPWIAATDLSYSNQLPVNLSKIFSQNRIEFSESVQVRWEQVGSNPITPDVSPGNLIYVGYNIDDVCLFRETNDIEVVNIPSPATYCGTGALQQIDVIVRNNSPAALTGVSLKLQVDENIVSEIKILSIEGEITRTYNFAYNFDFLMPGTHTIKVLAEKDKDLYPENNMAEISFTNMVISTFPYLENFETGQGGWQAGNCQGSSNNYSWEYGTPSSSKINKAASGTKAWKTNLKGNYDNYVTSYLYSPWFETGAMENPTLSFSLALDLESCKDQVCDIAYVEYFTNGSWKKLGVGETGTNWYNNGDNGWSIENFNRWHVGTISLPKGLTTMRLRFVIQTNWAGTREGIAIDDIHIYDLKQKIFNAGPASSPIMRDAVKGTDWVDFTENNRIIASIMANQMNLGKTVVQTHQNQQRVRNSDGQYYLDRNFTIKPANNAFPERVAVRLYFTDSETESLINAAGCLSCDSPVSAYELAVSKYNNPNSSLEDGTLENNRSGVWSFFSSDKVRKVPYDIGYYAEFETSSFSEFWLAKNSMGKDLPLPVDLISFEAKKKNGMENERNVLLEWTTSSEKNFSRFDVELAVGSIAVRSNSFSKIGEVKSQGNATSPAHYEYTDYQQEQSEVLYYRLKMIDTDNSFTFSAIKSVVPDKATAARFYPNPSNGLFNVEYQAENASASSIKVYDMSGRLVKSTIFEPTTSLQKQKIDLSSSQFKTGLYLIELTNGPQKNTFKVLKEDMN